MSGAFVQEIGHRKTSLGPALYIKVRTEDYRQLPWTEVWEAFASRYPGRWAAQFFPPVDSLLDEENIYHLYVLDDPPWGVDINRR
jgi:hypothetical protein